MTEPLRFPEHFLWGAATSAHQIEGSPLADGAGPSTWHRFARTPGRILGGEHAEVACDHYRRYEQDVALMRELELQAYRFSVSWSRVLPEGRGTVNRAGLDFYQRLIDRLLENGITPCLTLYHWDLPAALDDRGGWLNPDSAQWFADYAELMFRTLDDRVPLWSTLNEPWVVVDGGYLFGVHAPGHRSIVEAPIAAHHLLVAHGTAVQRYRAVGRHQIGLVVNIEPKDPATTDPADVHATRVADAYMNRFYLDPVLRGAYPAELAEVFGEAFAPLAEADLSTVSEPIDFLGINYYTRAVVRADAQSWPTGASRVHQPASPYTETGWEVHAPSFTRMLLDVTERYGRIPLYITENGAAFYDPPVAEDGRVDDPLRVSYFRSHLRAVHAALEGGADLRGYFAWSLLDNFEWSEGYSKRFGIVHVDFATQRRTPKASAHYYRDVIRSHGSVLGRG